MAHSHKKTSGLGVAFFLNLLFSIIEFIGGYLTQSSAIIADAFHDLMDALAIGFAVLLEKFAKKPANDKFTMGFKRFSLLSAIILSLILLIGSVSMIYYSITNFSNTKEVNSIGMFGLAVLGISVNVFGYWKIKSQKSDKHNHSSHSHHHNSANEKAVMLHLLEDVLGWLAVLIGAVIIYFTQWHWIDNILTLFIAIFIGYNAINNLWHTFKILLQIAPDEIDTKAIKNKILAVNHVVSIDKLYVWSLDGSDHVASLIITINNSVNSRVIIENISNIFKESNIEDITIQTNLIE